MTYKFLLTIFLTSLSSIGTLTQVATAIAQERPECYLIDDSGQLTDLTDICNVSEKQLSETDPATSEAQNNNSNNNSNNNIIIDSKPSETGLSLDDNLFILGKNNLSSKSGLIGSAYYVDNEIGIDYTAYIRRYKTPPSSIDRQTLREQIFQFNTILDTPSSLTSILRSSRQLPFIIYRY